ncbi:MAG: S41 family peptidase [Alphaproteobacteria bacterium]|nr:S41 family peptidase [Alphaproteobacteria bacterium]
MTLRRLTAATAVALFLTLPAVAFAQSKAPDDKSKPKVDRSEIYQQLNLFGDILERVRNDYVEPPNEKDLIENAINGMLSSLDPHSSYMNPKSFKDMQVQTRGEFGGLGIEVTMENGVVKVVSPIDDTPAAKAGLQPGDLIVTLDGTPVMGLTLQEAVEKMRGRVDTSIKLGIRRAGKDPFDVTLTRAVIKVKSVRARVEGGDIGYIRITSFTEQTTTGLQEALSNFKKEMGTKWKGVVLDLRNNPGGLLDQAISVSDAFLERGEIVSTRARKAEDVQRWEAKPGDLAEGLPIVVIVNGGSASASEIVAGALQDHKRAIILGTRSFGKGSVQTIMPVTGGGAIRLTTALYFTPSGRSIQKDGIKPDIEVEQSKIETIRQQGGIREENLRGSINNPRNKPDASAPAKPPAEAAKPDAAKPDAAKPDAAKPGEGGQDDQAADYQLLRALDLVRGIALYANRDK